MIPPFKTPSMIVIDNPRVACLNLFFQCLAILYPLSMIWATPLSYSVVEVPTLIPTFWFESAGTSTFYPFPRVSLYDAQNVTAANPTPAFCDNASFDYRYTTNENDYWNDKSILCRDYDYAEMTKKELRMAFVSTMIKELDSVSQPCAAMNFSRATAGGCAKPTDTQRSYFRHLTTPYGDDKCVCDTLQDWFPLGATSMVLGLEHQIITTSLLHNIEASSTRTEANARARKKTIQTTVLNKGAGGGDKHFADGETVSLTLDDWLHVAGDVSLDERVAEDAVTPDATTGLYPHRRSVGGRLRLTFTYDGDAHMGYERASDSLFCEVEATWQDMWGSMGSTVFFDDARSLDTGDVSKHYLDSYRRGIIIEFYAQGAVSKFDWNTLVATIVAGMVLFNVVPKLMLLIVMYCCGPKSVIYTKAIKKPLCYERELARFAANVAIIATMFKLWDTSKGDQERSIDTDELAAVFKSSFSEDDSKHLARLVMREGNLDDDDGGDGGDGGDTTTKPEPSLGPRELIMVMADELVSVPAVLEFEKKATDAEKQHGLRARRKSKQGEIASIEENGPRRSGGAKDRKAEFSEI